MAKQRLGYRWKLREVMEARGLWHTTDLRPLLVARGIDLSPAQVHRLVTQTPERLSLRTLMALCDALDCEIPTWSSGWPRRPPSVVAGPPGRRTGAGGDVVALRPKPARIAPRPPGR